MSVPSAPETPAFLAAIVNSSTDAIISKNLEGIITSWNRAAERLFGYSASEVIGQPVTVLFPPERYSEESAILERIKRGESVEHYETSRRRKDGSNVDVSLTISPIFSADGRIIGASKIVRDITAQRREQERWRVTLSSIGDAVISTDEKGKVVFMNGVAEQLTGWKAREAANVPIEKIFRIVNEHSRQTVESPVTKVLREGKTVGLANHTILIGKDGAERMIDDSGAPIRNGLQELCGVVLVFRDVTDRRAAELAALRLAAIIEGSDDAIVGKDLRGIVTSWNPGAERVFGYSAAEMVGQSITRLIPPDRLDEEELILARLRGGERVDHFQTIRRHKAGHLIHVSLTISPIRDNDGQVIGVSKIARDVTALRVAQQKLEAHASELETKVRERTAKLEETVAELEAFSYSLSHDMRAPLRAIQSFSEIVLADHGHKIPEATEYLRKVISAASRMDRLIQDVLSFARLSRSEIRVETIDVDKLINDIIHERPELHKPKAVVKVESPLLPVLGHDASLTQCLTNLLGNAVKFVAPNVTPNVQVFTKSIGEKVRICVRDNGIGMSDDAQRRLFGIFERVHGTQRYEGTGVGLAIARKAAERMSGTIGVESAEGKGSTFWLELPAAL